MKARIIVAAALMALLVMGVMSTGAAAASGLTTRLVASTAFPAAKGKANYDDRGGELRFRTEVEGLTRLAGSTISVYVGGVKAGAIKVSATGTGTLALNSTLGQKVPAVRSGSVLQVKTAAGALILSGTFR